MSYVAPIKDMLFCMKQLAAIDEVAKLPGFEEAGLDTAQVAALTTTTLGNLTTDKERRVELELIGLGNITIRNQSHGFCVFNQCEV